MLAAISCARQLMIVTRSWTASKRQRARPPGPRAPRSIGSPRDPDSGVCCYGLHAKLHLPQWLERRRMRTCKRAACGTLPTLSVQRVRRTCPSVTVFVERIARTHNSPEKNGRTIEHLERRSARGRVRRDGNLADGAFAESAFCQWHVVERAERGGCQNGCCTNSRPRRH